MNQREIKFPQHCCHKLAEVWRGHGILELLFFQLKQYSFHAGLETIMFPECSVELINLQFNPANYVWNCNLFLIFCSKLEGSLSEISNAVSSEKILEKIEDRGKSLTHIKDSIGPGFKPCGTPQTIRILSDQHPFTSQILVYSVNMM